MKPHRRKTLKALKLYSETWYVNGKFSDNDDILYIVEKNYEKCYSTKNFSKTITETIPLKNLKNPEKNPES